MRREEDEDHIWLDHVLRRGVWCEAQSGCSGVRVVTERVPGVAVQTVAQTFSAAGFEMQRNESRNKHIYCSALAGFDYLK